MYCEVKKVFFFLICLLIITLNNYIYKTHTHKKKKLSNYYRRCYKKLVLSTGLSLTCIVFDFITILQPQSSSR